MTGQIGRSRALDLYTAGKNINHWFKQVEKAQRKCDKYRDALMALSSTATNKESTRATVRLVKACEARDVCLRNLATFGVDVDTAIMVSYGTPGRYGRPSPLEGTTWGTV